MPIPVTTMATTITAMVSETAGTTVELSAEVTHSGSVLTCSIRTEGRIGSPLASEWAADLRGDGFVGGLLYAILRGWPAEQWIQFGWATGALVTTLATDYAQPADEEQIWSIWKGNARVRR